MNRLPDKLSDLILLALTDLEKAEADPDYTVCMQTWHLPNSTCKVCFAGCVMAFSLGVSKDADCRPYRDFDLDTQAKLCALDDARLGFFKSAAAQLGLSYSLGQRSLIEDITSRIRPPAYTCDPIGFKESMRDAVEVLAKAGY